MTSISGATPLRTARAFTDASERRGILPAHWPDVRRRHRRSRRSLATDLQQLLLQPRTGERRRRHRRRRCTSRGVSGRSARQRPSRRCRHLGDRGAVHRPASHDPKKPLLISTVLRIPRCGHHDLRTPNRRDRRAHRRSWQAPRPGSLSLRGRRRSRRLPKMATAHRHISHCQRTRCAIRLATRTRPDLTHTTHSGTQRRLGPTPVRAAARDPQPPASSREQS